MVLKRELKTSEDRACLRSIKLIPTSLRLARETPPQLYPNQVAPFHRIGSMYPQTKPVPHPGPSNTHSDLRSVSTSTNEHDLMYTATPRSKYMARDLAYARWRPSTSDDVPTNNSYSNGYPGISLASSAGNSPASCTSNITLNYSGSEDSEPDLDTPLEYARYHGLCTDYEKDDPLSSELIPCLPEDAFDDPDEVPPGFDADSVKRQVQDSLNEKLDVDKETATLLLSVLAAGKGDFDLNVREFIDSRFRPMKLELPVLARDHEAEMAALRRRNEVKLTARGIEHFVLDLEKDEGLVFPTSASEDKYRLDRGLENEKLDVGRETVGFLHDVKSLAAASEIDHAVEAHEAYKVGSCRTHPVDRD